MEHLHDTPYQILATAQDQLQRKLKSSLLLLAISLCSHDKNKLVF